MKRIQRSEINALPDFLTDGNFVLMFGSIPGSASTKRLALQCKSTSIPGETVERLSEQLSGYDKGQAGNRDWSHTFSVTFAETKDLEISSKFRAWMQYCRGTQSGSSVGDSSSYTVNVEVYVFDSAGNQVKTTTIYKVFPTEFPETTFQGGINQAIVESSITFGFDYASNSEVAEF